VAIERASASAPTGGTPSDAARGRVLAGVYGVSKRFGGEVAVSDATLELRSGEVHCLIGENGAGKSTLIKMIAGVHAPDTGEVRLGEGGQAPKGPHDALQQGVNTIYQELTLVPEMTVAENVALGHEPVRRVPFVLARRRMRRWAADLFAELGIDDIGPDEQALSLGVARQQLVEIVKAVSREGERVVIMDEPTAPLTIEETETLFRIVRRLRERGLAILYITHRLEELDVIGDVVTVMRDGAVVGHSRVGELTRDELIERMVGRKIDTLYPARTAKVGEPVLEIAPRPATASGEAGATGQAAPEVPIVVRRGEVIGLFGLVGAGRTELLRGVYGADRPDDGYDLSLRGEPLRPKSVSRSLRDGIAMVPEDRKRQGIVPDLSTATNIALGSLSRIGTRGLLPPRRIRAMSGDLMARLRVKAASPEQPVRHLSGGNQQKCVIARMLALEPDVLVLDEPTRGVDVGARTEVYELINGLCESGRGILMITSDLPEALGMADRIVVMRRGRLVGEIDGAEATQTNVMQLALGVEDMSVLDPGKEGPPAPDP
jgi:ABC-type sugar transport system ATPase subunit